MRASANRPATLYTERHDDIVARAQEHGGIVVKGTGDGFLIASDAAAQAVDAAVAFQQAIERWNERGDEPLVVTNRHQRRRPRLRSQRHGGHITLLSAAEGSIDRGVCVGDGPVWVHRLASGVERVVALLAECSVCGRDRSLVFFGGAR